MIEYKESLFTQFFAMIDKAFLILCFANFFQGALTSKIAQRLNPPLLVAPAHPLQALMQNFSQNLSPGSRVNLAENFLPAHMQGPIKLYKNILKAGESCAEGVLKLNRVLPEGWVLRISRFAAQKYSLFFLSVVQAKFSYETARFSTTQASGKLVALWHDGKELVDHVVQDFQAANAPDPRVYMTNLFRNAAAVGGSGMFGSSGGGAAHGVQQGGGFQGLLREFQEGFIRGQQQAVAMQRMMRDPERNPGL